MQSEIICHLYEISPTDLPRDYSWQLQDSYDTFEVVRDTSPIDLSVLKVQLIRLASGLIFAPDGNHRLGKLTEKFGPEVLVRAKSTVLSLREQSGYEWQIALLKRDYSLYSYTEYLEMVKRGEFVNEDDHF